MVKLNWIWRNVLGGIAFIAGIVIVTHLLLLIITRHNRYVEVPDFSGLTYSEAESAARNAGVEVNIDDSVYVPRMPKGIIYSQQPKVGATVKKGRSIDLITTAYETKKVTMPSLVGMSLRQAKAEILSKGLSVGRLIYKADIATNYVLGQKCNGVNVAPGRQIAAGSRIDLVLGLNYAHDRGTVVPDVKGMNVLRAQDILQDNSLNVRGHFARGIRNYSDSLAAVVYKQEPDGGRVSKGTAVSIYLRLPE